MVYQCVNTFPMSKLLFWGISSPFSDKRKWFSKHRSIHAAPQPVDGTEWHISKQGHGVSLHPRASEISNFSQTRSKSLRLSSLQSSCRETQRNHGMGVFRPTSSSHIQCWQNAREWLLLPGSLKVFAAAPSTESLNEGDLTQEQAISAAEQNKVKSTGICQPVYIYIYICLWWFS